MSHWAHESYIPSVSIHNFFIRIKMVELWFTLNKNLQEFTFELNIPKGITPQGHVILLAIIRTTILVPYNCVQVIAANLTIR